jgi:hypothetical protein
VSAIWVVTESVWVTGACAFAPMYPAVLKNNADIIPAVHGECNDMRYFIIPFYFSFCLMADLLLVHVDLQNASDESKVETNTVGF